MCGQDTQFLNQVVHIITIVLEGGNHMSKQFCCTGKKLGNLQLWLNAAASVMWVSLNLGIIADVIRIIITPILNPIWTYGIQLWGTASTSNIDILEHFQSKALRMIMDAPWYVPNTVIRRDLQISTVKEEIHRYSSQYSARLSAHPNDLIVNLIELPDNRRFRRHLPNDLPTRFLV
jgi:hypothetical protein